MGAKTVKVPIITGMSLKYLMLSSFKSVFNIDLVFFLKLFLLKFSGFCQDNNQMNKSRSAAGMKLISSYTPIY